MSLRIVPVTLEAANAFVRRLHRHNKPVVGAALLALELVGVDPAALAHDPVDVAVGLGAGACSCPASLRARRPALSSLRRSWPTYKGCGFLSCRVRRAGVAREHVAHVGVHERHGGRGRVGELADVLAVQVGHAQSRIAGSSSPLARV